ncbi:hypothetical protein Tco_0867588, partial [Tanacetum coccineum]
MLMGDNIWDRKSGSVWLCRRRLKLTGIFSGNGGSLLLFSSSTRIVQPDIEKALLRGCLGLAICSAYMQ